MKADNKSSIIILIVAILAASMLAYAGISLICQSTKVYEDSFNYIDKALKADTALKGKIITAPSYATIKEGYAGSLLYFTLGLGVIILAILLPRLQTFSVTPTGGIIITLKDLQQQVTQLKIQNNEFQAASAEGGGGKTLDEPKAMELKALVSQRKKALSIISNDPQKNKWGGKAESNGRRLSAVVRNSSQFPSLYEVDLTVIGTNNKPLTGLVNFHLHDTFKNPNPVISAIDGETKLILTKVYGAFTVGAEADNGVTRLELDLAEDENFPEEFRRR